MQIGRFVSVSAIFMSALIITACMATTLKGQKVMVTDKVANDIIPGEWVGIYKSVNPRNGDVYNNDPARYAFKADGTGTYQHPRSNGTITWKRTDDGTVLVKYRRSERAFVLSKDGSAYHLQVAYQAQFRQWTHNREIRLVKK